MISPSSLSDFGWLSTTPPSVNPNASPSTATMGTDTNASPKSLDSFQNLLAQAVSPVSVPQTLSATSGMAWSNAFFPTSGESSLADNTNADIQGERTDAATKVSSDREDRASDRQASRTLSQRGTAKANSSSHAAPADVLHANGSGSAAKGVLNILPDQATSTQDSLASASSNPADANAKKSTLTGEPLPPNLLPGAAVTALGGMKALAGSAFALHITPAASQNNLNASNATPANGSASPTSASSFVPDATAAVGGGTMSPLSPGTNALPASAAQSQSPLAMFNGVNPPSGQSVPWSAPQPSASSSSSTLPDEPAATTAEVGEVAAEDQTGSPQPVRSLQLQLAGEGASRVDVRLVEHAGGLSVSVRASDSTLTRGLQENLPELSARLADDKYQTHTFLPPADASHNGSSSGSSDQPSGQSQEQGSRSFSQGGSNSGGHANSGQSNSQGGQQNGEQDPSAAWWRQFTTLGGASANTSSSVQDSQAAPAANPATNS